MKIESSALELSAARLAVMQRRRIESLKAWVGTSRPDFEGQGRAAPRPAADVLAISARAVARSSIGQGHTDQSRATRADEPESPDDLDHLDLDPKTRLLLLLIERITGHKIKLLSRKDIHADGQEDPPQAQASAPQRQGFGVEYDAHESYHEAETTTFVARGVVRTADGREIGVDLSLTMNREFYQESNISLRAGDAVRKDPLVVNFAGTAAELSGTRFAFDLDGDGRTESLASLGPGSGFLTIDRNGNGKIDNRGELFGPRSGDGFAELSREDADGNGWIDENDPAYGQLRVWTNPGGPEASVNTLEQAGIGAIALGSAETPFDLKDGQNATLAQVRQTGVYLKNDGSAGTVQKVDLFA